MIKLGIKQPESGAARSFEEALEIANRIGYPLMVRPSFVLGGRGMEVVYDEAMLTRYTREAIKISPEYPMLIDRFLEDAIEVEIDAVSDGTDTFLPAVIEHIELAGIHSGDSACVVPSRTISPEHVATIERYTDMIAKELNVMGIINVQYAIYRDEVYILEANPRASRTVPIVSKVMGFTLANIATKLMLGKKISDFPELKHTHLSYVGVKEAVFPFNMFPDVDPLLGPEMRATGEVMGIAETFGAAFYKAQVSAGSKLPTSGNVLLTVNKRDREGLLPVAKRLAELGFTILATDGTSAFLNEKGVPNTRINKITESRPHILDAIINREIQLVINTPLGRSSKDDDSFIRMCAIQHKIPYITTIAAAKASVEGIEAVIKNATDAVSLQEYYSRK